MTPDKDFTELHFPTDRECYAGSLVRGFRPVGLEVKDGILNLLPSR